MKYTIDTLSKYKIENFIRIEREITTSGECHVNDIVEAANNLAAEINVPVAELNIYSGWDGYGMYVSYYRDKTEEEINEEVQQAIQLKKKAKEATERRQYEALKVKFERK
jgi:hypothetical protein